MPKARSSVMTIDPYVGGDVTPKGMVRRIVLASNESPLGPSPLVLEFFRNFNLNLSSYPNGGASRLREAIASVHQRSMDHLICGNGSEDIIHLICRAYAGEGDEILMPQYGFLVYSIAAKTNGASPVFFPQPHLYSEVDRLLEHVTAKTKIVCLDNPGNPLGCMLTRNDLLTLHQNLPPHVLLVLDEAYAEYVEHTDYESGLTLFKDAKNVITLRTFSKAYGLAGMRIGWAHGAPEVLDALHRIRQPFNVNSIGQHSATIAVHDQGWIKKAFEHNLAHRSWTKEKLEELGFRVNPSQGNFLLFDCETPERAKDIYHYLGTRGVMIRPVSGYNLHHHMRVSIGRDFEMAEFIDLMKAFVAEKK